MEDDKGGRGRGYRAGSIIERRRRKWGDGEEENKKDEIWGDRR